MPIPSLGKSTLPGRNLRKQTTFKTATVVNDDTPISKVNQYIEGSSWKVNYFNQLKGENDLTGPLDESISQDLQQYTSIKHLELKVQTPLDVGNIESATGTAVIAVGIVPQVGDMFIARVSDSREAILTVIEVDKEHYNLNAIFKIDFRIDTFMDVDTSRYDNLMIKVVREYYFDENYVLTESAPILLESDYGFKKRLEREIPIITEYFFNEIMDPETRLLLIPNQSYKIIDPLVETFIFKIVNFSSHTINLVQRMSNGSIDPIRNTIWDNILNRYTTELSRYKKISTLVNLKDMAYSENTVDSIISNYINLPNGYPDNILPVISPENNTYLFTANFYDNVEVENLSTIEKLVLSYINNDELDRVAMEQLLDSYRLWNAFDKYYYLPILLILVKESIRKTHSLI